MNNVNDFLRQLKPKESYLIKPKPEGPVVKAGEMDIWKLPIYNSLQHNPPSTLRPGAEDNKRIPSKGF